MTETFTAQVENWVQKASTRQLEVFHESAREVASDAMQPKDEGGNMPVVTGNLRRSLQASKQGVPAVAWRTKEFEDNSYQLESVITSAEIGDSIYLGFTAPYAQKVELHDGNGFVRLTAQRWPQIVEEAVRSVKERDGGK